MSLVQTTFVPFKLCNKVFVGLVNHVVVDNVIDLR